MGGNTVDCYFDSFELWKEDNFFDSRIRTELASLDLEKDKKEIEDRFYCDLEFGTGGLRGLMGAGTNRLNKYTVGKATLGLGNYLLDTYGLKICQERGVAIAYDTRNNSRFFSKIAADVLSGMGVRVYLHSQARPTPQLSFSVKFLNTLAGIVITASHNPKEYNGYKVYDDNGCQLVPYQAKKVTEYINAITNYHDINFNGNEELIQVLDVTDNFVKAVLEQSRLPDRKVKENLRVLYTPLHGTGYVPISQVLRLDGFTQVDIVEEQAKPDGNFQTVVSPNPEDRKALKMGIEQAINSEADIVLGTDPDCDRVGVAVKTGEGYQLLTGNQIGALLMDFILENTDLSALKNPAVIKTIVTSELGAKIAQKKGLTVFSTLTGFKYIGEKITQFEQAKLDGNSVQDYDFVFGYEESYGYLAGTHARDKDAVVATLLICEMAAKYKAEGKTLFDRMNEIYDEFGYYLDALDSFTLKGKDGLERIKTIMIELRNSDSPIQDAISIIDYSSPVKTNSGFEKLPASNVLKYILSDGSWIAIRPSGTEPKIKIYYSIIGPNKTETEKKISNLRNLIQNRLNLKGE